jgi:hypothetical protein
MQSPFLAPGRFDVLVLAQGEDGNAPRGHEPGDDEVGSGLRSLSKGAVSRWVSVPFLACH